MSSNIYNNDLVYQNITPTNNIPISSTTTTSNSNTFSLFYIIILIFIIVIIIIAIIIIYIYLTKDENITLKDTILQYLEKLYGGSTNIFNNSLSVYTDTKNKENEYDEYNKKDGSEIVNDKEYRDKDNDNDKYKNEYQEEDKSDYRYLSYDNSSNINNDNNNINNIDNDNENIYKLLEKAVDKQKQTPSAYETNKQGYCFVGKNMNSGLRTCAEIGIGDKCMSGEIFPSREICINPSLRP